MSELGNKEIFSKNLRYYMMVNNKSRNEICKDLAIKYTTFADWYNGNIYPRIDKIELLANYLGIEKSDLIEEMNLSKPIKSKAIKIPVLGKIPAGIPIEAVEDILDYEEISEEQLKGDKTYFALQIEGNSMEPKYHSKDVLIVLKQDNCESGQDAVVMVNGYDATFKRIIKTDSGIMLQPINPEFLPVFYDNQQVLTLPVKILGIPIEIRRKLN